MSGRSGCAGRMLEGLVSRDAWPGLAGGGQCGQVPGSERHSDNPCRLVWMKGPCKSSP